MNNYRHFSVNFHMQNEFQIVFYNLDNFFDPFEAKHTLDLDFTPKGKKKWGPYRYAQKVRKIAHTFAYLFKQSPVALIGLAEIETSQICQDLLNHPCLATFDLDFTFISGKDSRGINTALIYNKSYFKQNKKELLSVETIDRDQTIFSRGILHVSGLFYDSPCHIFINHWPSNRRRLNRSLRTRASQVLHNAIYSINLEKEAILILGDFNQNPDSEHLEFLQNSGFTNPLTDQWKEGYGSLKHLKKWYLYDQIFLSPLFSKYPWTIQSAHILKESFLLDPSGRNKGQPYRTFIGKNYIGGQSDHFPVTVCIKKTQAR